MSELPTSARISQRTAVVLLLLLLSLAFQGSRGLWEPDEGRHGSIAVAMLEAGEWLVPHLSGQHFIDKPPLLFWGMAGGIALLGQNEWGARICLSLFYLLTAVAVAGLGRALWNRAAGYFAALAWGTSFLPFVASNAATPDLPLACFSAWAWLGVVRASRATTDRARLWAWILTGLAAGLGMLTKGPAILVQLPALLAFLIVDRRVRTSAAIGGIAVAGVVTLAVAGLWYLPILLTVPGAGSYLIDNQVSGRLLSGRYERHPGLAGALLVYLPTLFVGALPWWPSAVAAVVRRARTAGGRACFGALLRSPAAVLVTAGILVPVAVFSFASSKLPLYLLPVLTPIALVAGWTLGASSSGSRPWRTWLMVWVAALLAFKAAAAYLPVGARDSRELEREIASRVDLATTGVIVVGAQANGLHFYGVDDFHWLRSGDHPYPLFEPPPKIETALPVIAHEHRAHLVLFEPGLEIELRQRFESFDLTCKSAGRFERLAGFVCSPVSAPVAGTPAPTEP
ncbi:MAG: glycosyltransferase family 39 protein [Thermoanaerobaculia bacterium]